MKNAETGYLLRVPYPQPERPKLPLPPPLQYRIRRTAAGADGIMTLLYSNLQRAAVCRTQGKQALAEVLDAGAQTALIHLRLLAQMLVCCGTEPNFFVPRNGHKIWWSAAYGRKCQKMDVLTKTALQDALSAAAACRALAETLPPTLAPCAERMLADWEHHADWLREMVLQEVVSPL